MSKKAMTLALEALRNHSGNYKLSKAECVKYNAVEKALEEALASEQEQRNDSEQLGEPVAWQVHPFDYGIGHKGVYARTDRLEQVEAWKRKGWTVQPLYTTPQPKQEQGEPVACIHRNEYNEYRLEPHDNFDIKSIPFNVDVLLFKGSQPAQKPLTDEFILQLWEAHIIPVFGRNGISPIVFARAIEAAHDIKENT